MDKAVANQGRQARGIASPWGQLKWGDKITHAQLVVAMDEWMQRSVVDIQKVREDQAAPEDALRGTLPGYEPSLGEVLALYVRKLAHECPAQ